MDIFSIRLRAARGDKSQSEICNVLRVKQVTYSTWEKGKYEPKLETLVALAKYFEVSSDWLLGLSDSPNSEPNEGAACEKLKSARKAFENVKEAISILDRYF